MCGLLLKDEHTGEDLPRLRRVAMHLRHERTEVVEFFLVAQFGYEFDFDPASI